MSVNKYKDTHSFFVFLNSLMVEFSLGESEVLGSNPPSHIFFPLIVYQEQGHVCVYIVL